MRPTAAKWPQASVFVRPARVPLFLVSGPANARGLSPLFRACRCKLEMSGSPQVRNVGEPSDWWFNLRPSNTEPVLRLNVEADDESLMIEKRDALLAQIGGC